MLKNVRFILQKFENSISNPPYTPFLGDAMINVKESSGADIATIHWFVNHGFSVIPVYLGSKRPKIKWGKYQHQLPTENELRRWFWAPCNAAVVTGTNNLVVIDFDDITEYIHWSLWAGTANPIAQIILRDSYKVRTSRGIHVYTRCSQSMRNFHFNKIDIKAKGGLVTLPGSIHPSGARYEVYQEGSFPLWNALTEIFPEEVVESLEVERNGGDIHKSTTIIDYSDAQVLDMKPKVDVNQVKRAHRIEDYLPEIAFTGDHWGLTQCPFHDDKNPSFWVDTEKQLCGCFSGCTAKPLDIVNLFARLNNISNSEAIRRLGEK